MRKAGRSIRIVPLAVALLVAPSAEAKKQTATRPTSVPQSFWYGADVPAEAGLIHDVLTSPMPDGSPSPIRQLVTRLRNDDNNPSRDFGLQRYDPARAEAGYTLLSNLLGAAILVDMSGNEVKRWPLMGFPAKMLPGGSVMGYRGTGRPGYGDYHDLVQLGWCGAEEWSWSGGPDPASPPPYGARVHHDYQREGNPVGYPAPGAYAKADGTGKTWLLVHREPSWGLTTHVSDVFPLEDDAVVEVDADGNITWEWNAYEHVEARDGDLGFGFDALGREAVRRNKVANIDAGIAESDWQHVNAISLLGPNKWYEAGDERFHPENIIMDGRSTNIIWIVARHDDPQGRWRSGAIVWRTGPNYGVGHPENQLGQIIGQHTAHMIPAGLPGHGNILVFDNGGLAGFGSLLPGLDPFWPVAFRTYSRAVEYDPITFEKVWEYTAEADDDGSGPERRFFSWFISSVQRLKNGNTLIMEGADGRAFEVTPDGEVVWEYLQPRTYASFPAWVYRAYRYPESYLPKDLACP